MTHDALICVFSLLFHIVEEIGKFLVYFMDIQASFMKIMSHIQGAYGYSLKGSSPLRVSIL